MSLTKQHHQRIWLQELISLQSLSQCCITSGHGHNAIICPVSLTMLHHRWTCPQCYYLSSLALNAVSPVDMATMLSSVLSPSQCCLTSGHGHNSCYLSCLPHNAVSPEDMATMLLSVLSPSQCCLTSGHGHNSCYLSCLPHNAVSPVDMATMLLSVLSPSQCCLTSGHGHNAIICPVSLTMLYHQWTWPHCLSSLPHNSVSPLDMTTRTGTCPKPLGIFKMTALLWWRPRVSAGSQTQQAIWRGRCSWRLPCVGTGFLILAESYL